METIESGMRLLQDESVAAFFAAAARYCALVEPESTPAWTLETMRECRGVLADLYAAALRLPPLSAAVNYGDDGDFERIVTEESYRRVRRRLRGFFADEDRFPEAQQEAQKLSERPVSVSVSERMADLYQALADPVWNLRQYGAGILPTLLPTVAYAFEYEWGKSLLTVLKQLHDQIGNPLFEPGDGTLSGGGEEDFEEEDNP